MDASTYIKLLENKGLIKQGNYTLKSGKQSNFYIDLRNLGRHRELIKGFVSLMKPLLPAKRDGLALLGVPDGATSLAAYLAATYDIDHLILPKQVKDYGHALSATDYQNHEIILIEDVVSTGSSIVEVLKRLEDYKANVTKVLAIIDRDLGGREKIQTEFPHLNYQSVITLADLEKNCNLIK